jgi:hypothetical protein
MCECVVVNGKCVMSRKKEKKAVIYQSSRAVVATMQVEAPKQENIANGCTPMELFPRSGREASKLKLCKLVYTNSLDRRVWPL